ncbi:MAG: LamB/YcsF family protein [Phycisphaerae bacterium]|nr:LamB/YcsF family protein [Phycisphaerae bacterium]
MTRRIDLNCDLGEHPARIADGSDFALLRLVTSANIASGGHAGDEPTMREIVREAHALGVRIGAHPGYPDRANFGRVELRLPMARLKSELAAQIARLVGIAREEGAVIAHVKPHGALYHAAMTDRDIARALAEVAADVDPSLILIGLAGAPALEVWRSMKCPVAAEAFADRRYEADGSLRARTQPDALITDPDEAAAQALMIVRDGAALSRDGTHVRLAADSMCIHSDTPGSLRIASSVRARLESAGIAIRAMDALP